MTEVNTTETEAEKAVRATLEEIYEKGRADGRREGYAEAIAAARALLLEVSLSPVMHTSERSTQAALIGGLKLSVRVQNCLLNHKVVTVADLLKLTTLEIRGIRNIGTDAVEEIQAALRPYGYMLRTL